MRFGRAACTPGEIGDTVHRVGWHQGAAVGFANLGGAGFVYIYTSFVLDDFSDAPSRDLSRTADALFVLGYMALAVAVGGTSRYRRYVRRTGWLEQGEEATDQRRLGVLRLPRDTAMFNLVPWVVATVLFAGVSGVVFDHTADDTIRTASAVMLGGLVTCALSYMLMERAMRPLFALALDGHVVGRHVTSAPRGPSAPGPHRRAGGEPPRPRRRHRGVGRARGRGQRRHRGPLRVHDHRSAGERGRPPVGTGEIAARTRAGLRRGARAGRRRGGPVDRSRFRGPTRPAGAHVDLRTGRVGSRHLLTRRPGPGPSRRRRAVGSTLVADAKNPQTLGPNEWLVDEMYEQFRADPASVSESWREFFKDYRNDAPAAAAAPAPAPEVAATPAAPKPDASPATPAPVEAAVVEPEALKGASARIAANMERSLEVPTATSFREVPAKLLEVNRKVINGYLGRTRGGKVSFTHLIGYAVVRAIADHQPVMNHSYLASDDDKPQVLRNQQVNIGVAVDQEKADGTRTLLVPVIKGADALDFRAFMGAYEELIRKVRSNKLAPDDFAGATVSLTNPGTIGTKQSVPRLMPGQGTIIGVGAIDYPAHYQGADPATLADLGVSKVVTVTSTYDHRIIQGAESGLFLQKVQELLLGGDGFYDAVFRSLGVPYEAVQWRRDVNPVDREEAMLAKQVAVDTLIRVHRVRGHLIADLDPLAWKEPEMEPELDPATYGLTIWDLDREFLTGGRGLAGKDRMPLGDILGTLRDAYCRTIGVEYMFIQEMDEQRWIQEQVEGRKGDDLSIEDKRHVLAKLNAAEAFEEFLATKYVGQKRFGLQGAESAIPILDAVLEAAADADLDGVVMGMAHRGRLNVLTNIVGKSYSEVFKEFDGMVDPETTQGSGDVKYHLGQIGKYVSRSGKEVEVELSANPSHLETVDPIVIGMARAKQDQINEPGSFSVMPLLIHGDSAFAGQGVVAETLQCGMIKGYRVGGTIHLIINNQLGFTTPPESARSSEYCTDVAKMVQAPIFHVNGDDPEACVRVARLAFAYRERFNKDVVIDMICYRRLGHNEGDDPSYTQPLMYKRINARRSVRKLYTEALVKRGDISIEEAEQALDDFQSRLQGALTETRDNAGPKDVVAKAPPPPAGVLPRVATGVDRAILDGIYDVMCSPPEGFTIHPKLARQFDTRTKMFREEGEVDWALGEAFAYGSLLLEGTDIRLAGQDSRRGTFSHRHAVLVDNVTEADWAPLANLDPDQAKFWVYDSFLSEYAALGFEYGYSFANKQALVMWEAQFGDFVNGAQIVIDQYIVAAEDKWQQGNGLVMLLPHGYEGQGPEHSSARIERFLSACAEDNIQVCNATTAAQFFHMIRRQMHRQVRKPLIVFTPKSLLRAKSARSKVDELIGGSFLEVLADPTYSGDPSLVRRVVLASGKVGHDAIAARDEKGAQVPVLRIEQLYPWPFDFLADALSMYPNADELVWLQEEPENMGPWNFVKGNLYEALGDRFAIKRVSRYESGSPATGSKKVHDQEQAMILEQALTVE